MNNNPGLSLFNNGVSLHVDAVNQQEAEEEQEEEEERKRIQAELQANLQGAFDDLDLDGDDDEGSGDDTLNDHQQQLLTPGQVPLKNLTSTPFTNQHFQGPGPPGSRFHQLQVEETCVEEEEDGHMVHGKEDVHMVHGKEDDHMVHANQNLNLMHNNQNFKDAQQPRDNLNPVFHTNQVHQTGSGQHVGGYPGQSVNIPGQSVNIPGHGGHLGHGVNVPPPPSDQFVRQVDYFNKSDNEKVKENEQLFSLYTARGHKIEQLEKQLDSLKNENTKQKQQLDSLQGDHAAQLRQLRQHLACVAVEKDEQGSNVEKLEQLLADSRRENQLLKDEIHPLKEKLTSLQQTKDSLELEHEGDKETIVQLQQKIRQLETTDIVLRARQQYDALVRSMKERHDDEVQKLRMEVDKVTSVSRDKEQDLVCLREKLNQVQNNLDFIVTEKNSLIDEYNAKLNENQRKLLQLESSDDAAEIVRLQTVIKSSESVRSKLEDETRILKNQVVNLQNELAGYEAMGMEELSDSVVALGLGTSKSDGPTRLKEELHRSLSSNKSKREQISRLEQQISNKNEEAEVLRKENNKLKMRLQTLESEKDLKERDSALLSKLEDENLKLKSENSKLQSDLKHAEDRNVKVKKCMTELLEGNQEDKMEAIDSLREEYEEHCKNAVEQTKSLMEGEIKRLNIEVEVYNKTVLELRKKLDLVLANQNSQQDTGQLKTKLEELEKNLDETLSEKKALESRIQTLELEKEESLKKIQSLQSDLIKSKEIDEDKLPKQIESVLESRVEEMRTHFRDIWEKNRKGDIEEAVAAARLDWLKRLPEAEKPGGAARLSITQVEQLQTKLAQAAKDKEQLELDLSRESRARHQNETEIENLRNNLANLRKEMLDNENKLEDDLRSALSKQASQWQDRLTVTRQQEEHQRKQIESRYESDLHQLEERMRQRDAEAAELEAKLDRVETEYSLAREKWRRVLEDKNQAIQSLKKNNSGDVEMLKLELGRRVQEIDRQRAEMASMADRWSQEVKSIQEVHLQEKQELVQMREKYEGLKSKVRKYQRHVDQKENHYKQEYARLENECKSTLERLRGRMEQAYSAKEKEVEQELGNMRNQFTQELHNIANRKGTTDFERAGTPNLNSPDQGGLNKGKEVDIDGSRGGGGTTGPLQNIETESLKQYYVHTSRQIQQLLK